MIYPSKQKKSCKGHLPLLIITLFWVFGGCSEPEKVQKKVIEVQPIKHVLLISMDTSRADHFSCYGFKEQPTPTIDSLANQGVLFQNAVSPYPMTLPSHASLFTGVIPPTHGVRDNYGYQLSASNITLAEILKKEGFQTAAFIGSAVLNHQMGLSQGFDFYDDSLPQTPGSIHEFPERTAGQVNQAALQWLEKQKGEKSFMFLHYYDPHHNYNPPEPFASKFKENLYAGEIAYTDSCVAEIFKEIKKLDRWDSTLIIITSDHGESLGEHGEQTHGYYAYQATQKIPLIIKHPTIIQPQTIEHPVGLIDILPTVLGLLNIDIPSVIEGADLSGYVDASRTKPSRRTYYSESLSPTKFGATAFFTLLDYPWKYILKPRPELYHLQQDPSELQNLINKKTQIAKSLKEQLLPLLTDTDIHRTA